MTSFRELWIWKESHELMLEVHSIAKKLPSEEKFRKRDQIERSSSSVPDNIAEGYMAYYYNDKVKCFYTSRKEAAEIQNHIEALIGKKYLDREKGDVLIEKYERIIAGINSYINYIRGKKTKENKKGKGKN